jgi:hypothetical protein
MTRAMGLITPEAASPSMTIRTSNRELVRLFPAFTGPNRPNDAMPASPGHDEAGQHMLASLVNPHVPEVRRGWRQLTQSDLPKAIH